MARNWAWARSVGQSGAGSHLAGWAPDHEAGLGDALGQAGFQPSGKRSLEVIATRIAAGMQPVRRALPQLLPDGLGADLHLQMAHRITHHFHSKPIPTRPVAYALAHSIDNIPEARAQRQSMMAHLEELADAVASEEADITDLVDSFIRPIVQERRVGFMREVSWASGTLTQPCWWAWFGGYQP